jgi:hypothetical protein
VHLSRSVLHKIFLFYLLGESVSTVLKKRTAIGEPSDSILLVFLILCLIVLFWFLIGSTDKNQPLEPIPNNDTEPIIQEPEINETLRLEEAIQELKWEGCQLLYVEPRVYLDNTHYLGYEEFKSKALETKLVIMTPSDSGTILLVQIKNDQWIWVPS